MSSASLRATPWIPVLALAMAWGPCPAARAQSSLPPLRGAVDDAAPGGAGSNTLPADGNGIQDGGARPALGVADGKAPAPPPKFPPPKSKAKTADRLRPARKGPPVLPALQPYPTAVRQKGGVPIADTNANSLPNPAAAALPVTIRLRPKTAAGDDYAPLGIRAGSLIARPFITEGLGFDSNPDQTRTKVRGSGFSRTEGGLGLVSQWSSNEVRADLRGGYNDYFSDPQANRPDAAGTIDLKVDVNRDLVADAEQRFSIDTQRPGSPDVSVNTVSRPLVVGIGETIGATETIGPVSFGLHGSHDRVAYDDALLSNGAVQDLADGDYNDYGLRLRAGYEITPVVKPFVDLLVDDRLHDATVDLGGYRRDSVGTIGQLGSSFEFNHLFSGEVSGGYGSRDYDDKRLKALAGPVLNGSISYAVTPLTVVSLQAATTFDETTVPGSSGAQSQSITLNATHQLLRNLTLTGAVSSLDTRYTGIAITERTLSETLKAEYHLSRSLVATAAYTHQTLRSTAADSSFSQDVVLFGMRLQK